jgi:hypothetical protein
MNFDDICYYPVGGVVASYTIETNSLFMHVGMTAYTRGLGIGENKIAMALLATQFAVGSFKPESGFFMPETDIVPVNGPAIRSVAFRTIHVEFIAVG